MTELCEQAGVSRATLYQHYETVYDVLQDVEDDYVSGFPEESEAIRELSRQTAANHEEYESLETEYADYIDRTCRLGRILTGPNGDPSYKARIRNHITRVYQEVFEEQLGKGIKTDAVTALFVGARMYSALWWISHNNEVDPAAYSKFITKVSTNMLQASIETVRSDTSDIRPQ